MFCTARCTNVLLCLATQWDNTTIRNSTRYQYPSPLTATRDGHISWSPMLEMKESLTLASSRCRSKQKRLTSPYIGTRRSNLYINTLFVFLCANCSERQEPTPVQDHIMSCLSVCIAPMFNTKNCHYMSNSSLRVQIISTILLRHCPSAYSSLTRMTGTRVCVRIVSLRLPPVIFSSVLHILRLNMAIALGSQSFLPVLDGLSC